jgi:methylated-DNA-[protein]-cysteine S-methyltransferase
MKWIFKKMKTPIGILTLIADEENLICVLFPGGSLSKASLLGSAEPGENGVLQSAEKQLNEYFAGKRKAFHLPLSAKGTEFQKLVWQALSEIPFGVTKSYGDIAGRIGSPKASRAVGAANGKNPIPIIVPCHRVIGRNGTLTGFGGGLDTKKFLLELEGVSTSN